MWTPVLVEQAFTRDRQRRQIFAQWLDHQGAARRNSHDLILSVNDTGAGLTDAEKAPPRRAFLPRAAPYQDHVGLGAAAVDRKAFVVANGGKIEADSTGADQGTTVSIHLPLAPDAPQLEAAPDD
jgi:K+-sensing histidine kinase KdpD